MSLAQPQFGGQELADLDFCPNCGCWVVGHGHHCVMPEGQRAPLLEPYRQTEGKV